jgi:ABC-type molybdenum transport system ATPase subunit/photorepair protein PhrA
MQEGPNGAGVTSFLSLFSQKYWKWEKRYKIVMAIPGRPEN